MLHFTAGFFFLLCSTCAANIIQRPTMEVQAGTDLNLTCEHPSLSTAEYIFWYRQFPDQGPQFLITGYKGSIVNDLFKMSFSEDRKSSVLHVQNVIPGDTAMYLCALRDTALRANH
ncbi:hypothetical protein FKM82_020389, partial [Ascaphus truei]